MLGDGEARGDEIRTPGYWAGFSYRGGGRMVVRWREGGEIGCGKKIRFSCRQDLRKICGKISSLPHCCMTYSLIL